MNPGITVLLRSVGSIIAGTGMVIGAVSGTLYMKDLLIERPKYEKSRYFRKYKQKFYGGITSNDYYNVINYLEEEHIQYDRFDYKKEELVIGNTTYMFPWFEFISCDDNGNCIIAEQIDQKTALLCEDPRIKGKENIRLLINKNNYSDDPDAEKLNSHEMLIIYDDLSDLKKVFAGSSAETVSAFSESGMPEEDS